MTYICMLWGRAKFCWARVQAHDSEEVANYASLTNPRLWLQTSLRVPYGYCLRVATTDADVCICILVDENRPLPMVVPTARSGAWDPSTQDDIQNYVSGDLLSAVANYASQSDNEC